MRSSFLKCLPAFQLSSTQSESLGLLIPPLLLSPTATLPNSPKQCPTSSVHNEIVFFAEISSIPLLSLQFPTKNAKSCALHTISFGLQFNSRGFTTTISSNFTRCLISTPTSTKMPTIGHLLPDSLILLFVLCVLNCSFLVFLPTLLFTPFTKSLVLL